MFVWSSPRARRLDYLISSSEPHGKQSGFRNFFCETTRVARAATEQKDSKKKLRQTFIANQLLNKPQKILPENIQRYSEQFFLGRPVQTNNEREGISVLNKANNSAWLLVSLSLSECIRKACPSLAKSCQVDKIPQSSTGAVASKSPTRRPTRVETKLFLVSPRLP